VTGRLRKENRLGGDIGRIAGKKFQDESLKAVEKLRTPSYCSSSQPPKGAAVRSAKVILSSLAVVVLMGFFVPALADHRSGSGDQPPAVDPNVLDQNEGRGPDVLGSSESDGVLPFTGSELALFVLIGAVAIGAGVLTLKTVKTRKGETQQV